MDALLWMLICFGAVLVVTGIVAIVVGIALPTPATVSERESAEEKDVWVVIAEKVLGWFDKLIAVILSDDLPRSKRVTALGVLLILLGALCVAGGVYGIGATAAVAAVKAAGLGQVV
ncbi:hypothetical protein Mycch_2968 [Mycolicibacterium chubuense NBB4]|uniref:Uncharacterized protein n=1 Tax=Mycolicibacterium chubuense (strain NBB4) TaxID=710421 RepID=I4BKB5_MYCCN|nr:hypothetical protein [Mycolicibacterium chubuense]AFM17722.1 hypothetical protein Mycch_2968 [Mycolicibacterium chubuense NBB4]